jgi:hypothetical protein
MKDLDNILNEDDELNEDQLLNYLKGNSSADDMHAVEKGMADSSFVNDGVEGLQEFSTQEKINSYVQQINASLHLKLSGQTKKNKRKIQILSWEIITVIVVILLCLLGYAVIEMMRK